MAAEEFAIEQAHVLRHRFAPSDQLNRALVEMHQLQHGISIPRLLLASTRMVAVDLTGFYRHQYDSELRDVKSEFESHKREPGYASMSISEASAMYMASSGSMRVTFTPARQAAFKELTDPLMEIGVPDKVGEESPYRVVLELRQKLIGQEAIERAKEAWVRILGGIADTSSTHLYTISPLDIVGKDVRKRVLLTEPAPSSDEPAA